MMDETYLNIKRESLKAFIKFLQVNKVETVPAIGATETGDIDALWREHKGRLVEIIFHPDGTAQFVTTSTCIEDGKPMSSVDTLPVDKIMDELFVRGLSSLLVVDYTKLNNQEE